MKSITNHQFSIIPIKTQNFPIFRLCNCWKRNGRHALTLFATNSRERRGDNRKIYIWWSDMLCKFYITLLKRTIPNCFLSDGAQKSRRNSSSNHISKFGP